MKASSLIISSGHFLPFFAAFFAFLSFLALLGSHFSDKCAFFGQLSIARAQLDLQKIEYEATKLWLLLASVRVRYSKSLFVSQYNEKSSIHFFGGKKPFTVTMAARFYERFLKGFISIARSLRSFLSSRGLVRSFVRSLASPRRGPLQ